MRQPLIGLFLCALVSAQAAPSTFVTDLTLQGSSIGKNTFVLQDDGTFTSKSELKFGPTDVNQEISGRYQGKRFDQLQIKTISGGQTVEARLDGKMLSGRSGGDWTSKELEKVPAALFSNLHPQLLRGIFEQPAGDVSVFMLDSLSFITVKPVAQAGRVVKIDGASVLARPFTISFQGMQIEIAIDARDGWVLGMNVPAQKAQFVRGGVMDLFLDPLLRYPELSQPTFATETIPKVLTKTRDGVELASTIVRPKPEGKYPTILVRTPYGRDAQMAAYGEFYAKRGYAVVVQDTRGMGDSGGEWDPFMNERKDGADTVNWIATQPWSDGKVGMIGGSYSGLVQWQAAVERPEALKCIIPQVSPPDPFFNIPFDHGAFFLMPNAWWARIVASPQANMGAASEQLTDFEKFALLPLGKVDDAVIGKNVPFWDKWLQRDTHASWNGANYLSDVKKVEIPALLISGWWDGDMSGTTMAWDELRKAGRDDRWLIMGPWSHAFNTATELMEYDFGPESMLELDSVYLRFFDTYLKDKSVEFQNRSRAQIFLTGANEWRGMPEYPHKLSRERTLFLSAPGPANNAPSQGLLVEAPPSKQEPSRIFYNPAEVGASTSQLGKLTSTFKFSFDMLVGDELLFKSAPIFEPLDLCGPIELDLHFTSTAKDCDFYAMLVDIDKEGTMWLMGQGGKLRASYHKSMDKRTPLVPGKPYRATVKLWDVAHQFKTGHRLGLMISCNLFPAFDRNLGLAEPPATAQNMVTSLQTIYHDNARPSSLKFRVLPPLD